MVPFGGSAIASTSKRPALHLAERRGTGSRNHVASRELEGMAEWRARCRVGHRSEPAAGSHRYHSAMTAGKLRQAVHERPFRPFAIGMGDGLRYAVTHPEMIAVAPKAERTFIVAYGEDEHVVLDLLLVTALEFRSSGHSRRRAG